MSLLQLSDWCGARFPHHPISEEPTSRTFDIPWMVLDHAAATHQLGWHPESTLETILHEIADHAADNPHWLEISASA
jgi:CDP-paratose 2-epimerase